MPGSFRQISGVSFAYNNQDSVVSWWLMLKKFRFSFAKLVLGLALIGLAVQFGFSLWTYARLAGAALSFPYPLDYGEGPLLDQTLRLADGENIYKNDFSVPPYTISNYPPLFLLLQVPFAKIFGPAFWYGRLISILGQLLTAVFIGLTLWTLTGDRVSPAVGGLIFLAFPYGQYWSTLNRIDLLALVLSWAALFVIVRWADRRWGVYAGAALLVLSIYTRQSYALAAPFGAFVWLLAARRWRKAVYLALLTGGVALGLFLVVNLWTRGGFFLNIVTANVNPFYWNTVRWNMEELGRNAYLLAALIAVFLLAERFTNRTRSWLLALPYLAAAGLSALTIGKDGSNVNYLLELAAAIAFAAGAALAWLNRSVWVRVLAVAVLAAQVWMLNAWVQENFVGRIMERVKHEGAVAALFRKVSETEGTVLADEFMGLVPLAGKRLYYQPFEFKMLAEGGVWDETEFLSSIADGKFSLILWYQPPDWPAIESRWTARQRELIQNYYTRDGAYEFTSILRPKK